MDDTTDRADAEPDEWTLERRRAFHEELERRRRRLFRASQLIALALVLTVAAGVVLRLPESWWMSAVGAIALLGFVFRLADWKCPNCGERLRTRRSSSVCLGCGAPLE